MIIANGSTDVTTYFVLRDSTAHAPKTDVTVTDIDLYYIEELAAISAKADVIALAAADSAHSDNKGFHVGQGLYRIDWPDAAFDGGIGKKVILIVVCTGVDTTFLEVDLSPVVDTASITTAVWGAGTRSITDKAGFSISGTKTTLDALNDITVANVLAGVIEGTITLQQAQRLILSASVGVSSAIPLGPVVVKDTTGAKDRITATVDAAGNRTNVILDVT